MTKLAWFSIICALVAARATRMDPRQRGINTPQLNASQPIVTLGDRKDCRSKLCRRDGFAQIPKPPGNENPLQTPPLPTEPRPDPAQGYVPTGLPNSLNNATEAKPIAPETTTTVSTPDKIIIPNPAPVEPKPEYNQTIPPKEPQDKVMPEPSKYSTLPAETKATTPEEDPNKPITNILTTKQVEPLTTAPALAPSKADIPTTTPLQSKVDTPTATPLQSKVDTPLQSQVEAPPNALKADIPPTTLPQAKADPPPAAKIPEILLLAPITSLPPKPESTPAYAPLPAEPTDKAIPISPQRPPEEPQYDPSRYTPKAAPRPSPALNFTSHVIHSVYFPNSPFFNQSLNGTAPSSASTELNPTPTQEFSSGSEANPTSHSTNRNVFAFSPMYGSNAGKTYQPISPVLLISIILHLF
ncbi:hypothetical protein DSO57_1008794 [Entomophthora muscae]|uniref:Uncharacterized protein n=1 Tax=Entomophthora muscae TaxID=34485 RepID=A0ACC2UT34_9FUNG|nr:hypothetical protein DSO57_1008794 [Entomophthora muscae]